MKSVFLAICLVICVLLQLFFLQSWQTSGTTGSLILSFIVIAALFASTEELLWLALFGGLSSDLYASSVFGFYLVFYLLVAVIAKYFLKFGEIEYSWWKPMVFLVAASLVQAMVVSLPLLASSPITTVTARLVVYVSLTAIAGLAWYLLFTQLAELSKKINASKILR
jgi:rod shape-determining protein MreD